MAFRPAADRAAAALGPPLAAPAGARATATTRAPTARTRRPPRRAAGTGARVVLGDSMQVRARPKNARPRARTPADALNEASRPPPPAPFLALGATLRDAARDRRARAARRCAARAALARRPRVRTAARLARARAPRARRVAARVLGRRGAGRAVLHLGPRGGARRGGRRGRGRGRRRAATARAARARASAAAAARVRNGFAYFGRSATCSRRTPSSSSTPTVRRTTSTASRRARGGRRLDDGAAAEAGRRPRGRGGRRAAADAAADPLLDDRAHRAGRARAVRPRDGDERAAAGADADAPAAAGGGGAPAAARRPRARRRRCCVLVDRVTAATTARCAAAGPRAPDFELLCARCCSTTARLVRVWARLGYGRRDPARARPARACPGGRSRCTAARGGGAARRPAATRDP